MSSEYASPRLGSNIMCPLSFEFTRQESRSDATSCAEQTAHLNAECHGRHGGVFYAVAKTVSVALITLIYSQNIAFMK
jgi:hypothetical protein